MLITQSHSHSHAHHTVTQSQPCPSHSHTVTQPHSHTVTAMQNIFSSIVKKNENVNTLTKKSLKRLNGCLYQCFKKTRVSNTDDNSDIFELFDKRRTLR